MATKLNQRGKNVTTNIRAVAAKRGEQLGYSANGNLQFVKAPLQALYEVAVSTLFGKSTMLKSSDQLVAELRKHVRTAVESGDFDFVANLALHARTEMNIRTIPIVLVVEFAKALSDVRQPYLDQIKAIRQLTSEGAGTNKTNAELKRIERLQALADGHNYPHMRQLVADVIQRADQITDMYAYALEVFGGKNKVPMAIKRGVGDAFNKFKEYHFAKYNRDGAVKFRDVLRIVHPEAASVEQGAIFEKIMKETLEVPYTWETELSRNGQLPVGERKSNAVLWTELVKSGKVGYMALLRNLRNIQAAGLAPEVLREHVTSVISDPKRVALSKQLPFDFIEAYNIVKDLDSKMATAVSKAIDLSVGNMPQLGNKVWVIVDFSGSMGHDPMEGYSGYNTSQQSAISTATTLAAALIKANGDADNLAVTLFGSSAKTLKSIDTNNSVLGIKKALLAERTGGIAGSTNFRAALAQKSSLGFEPDTIIVLTDGEVNGFPYGELKMIAGKNVVKLAVNLSVATTTPMSQNDGWYSVAGWSPAMFKWIPAIRNKESVAAQLSVPYVGLKRANAEE
jgi:hypothetical protein